MEPVNELEGATASVKTDVRNGDAIVALSGEIDISNADEVKAAINNVTAKGPSRVVFDLSRLDYLDSSGIALLLAAAERSDVEVRHASPVISRLLHATGVAEVLHLPE
jgi:anti-sigma B factor antagonist